jgi:hypothetical protein
MDRVSLTYFVDFVMKSGTPKLSVARDFKERDKYEPFTDFYKNMRGALVEAHKDATPKKALDRFLASVQDEKRRKVYPAIVKGHKRFLGRKSVRWFQPPTTAWRIGSLDLSVNPEVGLIIDDVPHIIKLYFKEGRLVANRVASIVHLMTVALTPIVPGSVCGLLDVRRSKLHVLRAPKPGLNALLEGEAAAFFAMASNLESPIKAESSPAIEPEASNVVSIPTLPRPADLRALA